MTCLRAIEAGKCAPVTKGENAEELRLIANEVPALLSYIDRDARYAWCNESYNRAFGLTSEQIRGKHVEEVIGTGGWEAVRPHLTRALSGEPVTFENQVRVKDGSLYEGHVSFVPHRDGNGSVRGVVVLVNDVTDRKATERALRKSEQMLERSQSTAHVGSWEVELVSAGEPRVDRVGTVKWSAETFRIFGFEPGSLDLDGGTFLEHIHPDDRDDVRSTIGRSTKTAEPYQNEYRIVRPDGTVRVLHSWVDFEKDAAGRPIRVIGTCQDITERKRAEQELRDADRRKDEFLAMLSHELRNPLAPILSAVEIIEQAGPGESELRATFQAVITRQVMHMKRLLDDLLDVARVSRGKIQLRPERVDLATLLLQAVEVSRPMIVDKGHALEIALGNEPLPIDADSTRIVQVFANLINNAAKYTDAGGHITLTSRTLGGEAVVSVRDDGTGMGPDLLARAFDLFVQETRSVDRAQGGLGIGLTMVRTLVKMHGGSVEAFSEGPGRGSEFTVRLPLATGAPAARAVPVASGQAAIAPLEVLVVDDNVDAARGLEQVLALSGHRVMLAHDGPSALAAAAKRPPQVVLLDIGLPGMDGYTVAAKLREAGHDRAALVAITGYGQDDDLRRSSAAGFDRHLVKPIDGATLRKLLAEVGDRFGPAPTPRNPSDPKR
jgi:two-component system CheB/CheR fusion protein